MQDLDLLIINPGAAHDIYGELGNQLIAVEPPLWCRLIAGYVRDRGFSVKICDAEALGFSPEQTAQVVTEVKPRLVCLAVYGHQPSASTQQMDGAGKAARAIKQLTNPPPIIMVGGHVSALPKRTVDEEDIDYACIGEGPVTIANLLGGTETDKIPGLVWRDAGSFKSIYYANPSAPLLDLEELHGNTWELLPMERYRAHNWQCLSEGEHARHPYASIYTTLNCPYACHFCCISAPFGNREYRMRDPADVVAEMVMLYERYGVRTFKIIDEMFILNKRHYTAICEKLVAAQIAPFINIWAYARVDTVKPDTLNLLRRAGFRWLALGIESGSKYVRDGAQKRLKNDDIVGVVRSIQAANINVIGNYIFGLPDDDLASMQQTLDLAMELNCEFANMYVAQAYPGSKLYEDAVKQGKTLPESWRAYSQHNFDARPLDTDHISAREVLAFRDAAFRTYFSSPRYQSMLHSKFGLHAVAQINKMLEYKLPRKLLEAA